MDAMKWRPYLGPNWYFLPERFISIDALGRGVITSRPFKYKTFNGMGRDDFVVVRKNLSGRYSNIVPTYFTRKAWA